MFDRVLYTPLQPMRPNDGGKQAQPPKIRNIYLIFNRIKIDEEVMVLAIRLKKLAEASF